MEDNSTEAKKEKETKEKSGPKKIPWMPLAVAMLSLSIIIGCTILGIAIKSSGDKNKSSELMTEEECAQYMGVTKSELDSIVTYGYYGRVSLKDLINDRKFTTLKYVEVDGQKMFNKHAVDLWLEKWKDNGN